VAAARAGLAPTRSGRLAPVRVRTLQGWATATMLAVASTALLALLWAFAPLAELWAAHEIARAGGSAPYVISLVVSYGLLGLLGFGYLVAFGLLLGWQYRAAANLRVFPDARARFRPGAALAVWFVPVANWILPAFAFADLVRCSVGPARHRRGLVWAWWLAFLGAYVALGAGLATTDFAAQRELDRGLSDGHTVDLGGAGSVLAGAITGRLPYAVVTLTAATLLLVVIDRVTVAQHARFATVYIPAQRVPGWPPMLIPPAPTGTATGPWGATIGP
jgi:hypothetical protein